MTNIKIGNGSEKDLANYLRTEGFWVYRIPMKTNGQPCDIIAIRNNFVMLIDSKHVSKKPSFTFERIEPNQVAAMNYAQDFAKIKNVGFAVFFEKTARFYWYPFSDYKNNINEKKSVNLNELKLLEDVINENTN